MLWEQRHVLYPFFIKILFAFFCNSSNITVFTFTLKSFLFSLTSIRNLEYMKYVENVFFIQNAFLFLLSIKLLIFSKIQAHTKVGPGGKATLEKTLPLGGKIYTF